MTHVVHDQERIDLGGRELEIIFTPGHTPDALSLLDRKNGLLFTGDTYYPGPIYLFVPETDLAAYSRSITRLAALSSGLNLLLPAHNVPVADPKALIAVEAALKKVKDGSVKGKVTDGNREYEFDGFLSCYQPSSNDPPTGTNSTLRYEGQPPVITRNESTYYQSDIYTRSEWTYYPVVVWQFWGRAAEAL